MDYKIIDTSVSGELTFVSGDETGRISGVSSLVQEVLIELLSAFDSRTGRGSNLIQNINEISIQHPEQFQTVVSQAVRVAQAHLIHNQAQTSTLTAAEKLSSLSVVSASLVGASYSISLLLTNQANQTVQFQLPV